MRHRYMGDRRYIIDRSIHWSMLKNILWIMAKTFKYNKIRCFIIFLLVFGFFLEDDILDGQIHWDVHRKWTKIKQNQKTKMNSSRDAFYAAESPTNIRKSYIQSYGDEIVT